MVADTVSYKRTLSQTRTFSVATTKSLIVKADKAVVKVAKLKRVSDVCHNLTVFPSKIYSREIYKLTSVL